MNMCFRLLLFLAAFHLTGCRNEECQTDAARFVLNSRSVNPALPLKEYTDFSQALKKKRRLVLDAACDILDTDQGVLIVENQYNSLKLSTIVYTYQPERRYYYLVERDRLKKFSEPSKYHEDLDLFLNRIVQSPVASGIKMREKFLQARPLDTEPIFIWYINRSLNQRFYINVGYGESGPVLRVPEPYPAGDTGFRLDNP